MEPCNKEKSLWNRKYNHISLAWTQQAARWENTQLTCWLGLKHLSKQIEQAYREPQHSIQETRNCNWAIQRAPRWLLPQLKHQLRSSCSSIREHRQLHDSWWKWEIEHQSNKDLLNTNAEKQGEPALHFPPPKRWWIGFCRPNRRLKREVTDLFSSSKNDTDFFFGTVSAKVSTRLLINFSAVIFSGMIAIFKRNTNYSKKKN